MTGVVLLVDYFGKWVDDKKSWRWNSQNDTVRTMLVSSDVTFDKFMETIIRRGELSCGHDPVCVKYMTNAGAFSREKAPPVELKNDEDVQIYLNDINGEGGRPMLRVSLIEIFLESGCGLNNQQFENENVCTHNDDFHGGGETNTFIETNERVIEDVLPCEVEKFMETNEGIIEDVLHAKLRKRFHWITKMMMFSCLSKSLS
ncbi:uncharacterized protein LOC132047395 [Lycium ferocissimum]|uniref:uncharacterized protein LOC132047395 n=1 Tax=Lycium ferocissimum TaxID=112874 RepID=UPI002815D7C7|nr:uncharacterized protein LOC132047395 [Lycium ferocissimum]